MVTSTFARQDIDSMLLTKTITYTKFPETTNDLAYETYNRTSSTAYFIKAQVTVISMDSQYTTMGILKAGDLKGLFRYEYTEDASGNTISPTLTPKKGDWITFNSNKFSIKECTPATSEDSGIIGWDFIAGQFPNTE